MDLLTSLIADAHSEQADAFVAVVAKSDLYVYGNEHTGFGFLEDVSP